MAKADTRELVAIPARAATQVKVVQVAIQVKADIQAFPAIRVYLAIQVKADIRVYLAIQVKADTQAFPAIRVYLAIQVKADIRVYLDIPAVHLQDLQDLLVLDRHRGHLKPQITPPQLVIGS